MTEKVFIIHGWEGSPKEPMLKWLASSIENKGYEVTVPTMPNPEKPTIDEWVGKLKEIAPEVNEHTYFIGHSVGCQTILRYLESLPEGTKCGGVLLLAPWLHLNEQIIEEGEEEVEEIAKPWIETPINFELVRSHIIRIAAIFSDNDPYVPMSDKDIFNALLGADIHIEHEKGHFTEEEGVTQLPSALEYFTKISQA
ncbi:MAG: alpha/beta hydrolase [Nanoarchaeota archaeon]